MRIKATEDEIWSTIGFIKISRARFRTLECLGNDHLMPIEKKKKTRLTPAQVSVALHDLKKKGVVRCMNETVKKGRIYQCTELGLEIIDRLEKTGFDPDRD